MNEKSSVIQLIKILIGVAWLDGSVQIEEQGYLRKIAHNNGVAEDRSLKPWLYGLRSVSKQDCYQWVEEYLGHHPTPEAYNQLLEDLGGLIYSDSDVATEEAKLLNQIQNFDPSRGSLHRFRSSLTRAIQKFYNGCVNV